MTNRTHEIPHSYPLNTAACRASGFTLIEIMIVVVVVGILTAIALPNYYEHLRRSTLIEAKDLLAQSKIAMDQYFASKRSFANAADNDGPCATRKGKAFDVTCTVNSTTAKYTFTAVGRTGTRAAGFTYTIDQDGIRTMKTVNVGSSWPATANCWIFKKGESC